MRPGIRSSSPRRRCERSRLDASVGSRSSEHRLAHRAIGMSNPRVELLTATIGSDNHATGVASKRRRSTASRAASVARVKSVGVERTTRRYGHVINRASRRGVIAAIVAAIVVGCSSSTATVAPGTSAPTSPAASSAASAAAPSSAAATSAPASASAAAHRVRPPRRVRPPHRVRPPRRVRPPHRVRG